MTNGRNLKQDLIEIRELMDELSKSTKKWMGIKDEIDKVAENIEKVLSKDENTLKKEVDDIGHILGYVEKIYRLIINNKLPEAEKEAENLSKVLNKVENEQKHILRNWKVIRNSIVNFYELAKRINNMLKEISIILDSLYEIEKRVIPDIETYVEEIEKELQVRAQQQHQKIQEQLTRIKKLFNFK